MSNIAKQAPREMALPGPGWWQRLITRWTLRRCKQVGRGVVLAGRVEVRGDGDIIIGAGVVLDGRDGPIELCAHQGARLELGDGVRVRGGASLEARAYVKVGAGATVGTNVRVIDDAPASPHGRRRPPTTASVTIEDGAVLGARTILLPGAYVGAFARTAPSSIVARSVPACGVANTTRSAAAPA